MSLFLLGIPIALLGAKILHDNVKYTTMDLNIPTASYDLNMQYSQINQHFIQILQYSGAKCNIKKNGLDYEIKDIQKGQYGGLERYLAEKGYFTEAIEYAKEQFDNLADREIEIYNKEISNRLDKFEKRLIVQGGNMTVVRIDVKYHQCALPIIEKEVEKIIDYLHRHDNEDVHCNIIMSDGRVPFLNHQEIWHIKVPWEEDGEEYIRTIYKKLNIVYGDD